MKRRGFIAVLGALIPLGIWGVKKNLGQTTLSIDQYGNQVVSIPDVTKDLYPLSAYEYVPVYGYSHYGTRKEVVTRGVTKWTGVLNGISR